MPKVFRTADRALLLSIKPKFVEQLLRGSKVVELRRTRPRVKNGELVLIYETSPTKALVGYSIISAVISSSPQKLWPTVKGRAGITRAEFDTYFQGTSSAFAIELKRVQPLKEPVWLNTLRKLLAGFHPPQSYRYLSKKQMGLVLET